MRRISFFISVYLVIILLIPLTVLCVEGFKVSIIEIFKIAVEPTALHTYWVTLKLAVLATLCNVIFGLITAWVLVRYDFIGRNLLDVCVDLPFALPTAVAGLTLSVIYGNQGFITQIFSSSLNLLFSSETRVCIAMIFVSFPFVIRTIQPVLRGLNAEFEEVAAVLGASDWDIFKQIIFPRIQPSLVAGASLSLSRSLGEYGSIVILSSNLPFDDLVTPVLIFQKLEQYDYRSASIIGVTILILSLLILSLVGILKTFRFSHS